MKSYSWLLAIISSFICTQTYTDVIVTTGQDNPSGPIAGETTLRDAIDTVNSGAGGETIAFAPNVSTIQLLEPLPTITEQVTIDGLAATNGTSIQPGNCDSIPSPIDFPTDFPNSLCVIIDGSQIPQSNIATQAGLFFGASSVNSLVRGIRIQNIFGTPDSPLACGICSKELGQNTTVECCMIDTVFAINDPIVATKAIGLENISTVSKSYIRNVKSAPSNLALTSSITKTAPAYGIAETQMVTDTRVECVESGSILGNANITPSSIDFLIGATAGIFIESFFNQDGSNTRSCFVDNGGTEEVVLIHNCIIQHIKGGSILLTNGPAQVTLDIVSGIYIDTNTEATISNSCIENIQTGSATLSFNKIGSSNTELTTRGLFGIFSFINSNGICIQNNTVTSITHRQSEVDVDDSLTLITSPIGIFGSAASIVIENNGISSVFGGCHTTKGRCSTLETQQPYILEMSIGTSGIATNGELFKKYTRNNADCPLPISSSEPLAIICNNSVDSIVGGKLTASGESSIILGHGSIGIASSSEEPIVTNNNEVQQIVGVDLTTTVPNANSFLQFGSKGIVTASDNAEMCYNSISSIQEGKISTVFNSLHSNYEHELSIEPFPLEVVLISGSPAQTVGIESLFITSSGTSSIQNNTIKKVTGSQPFGAGLALAGIGTGISIGFPNSSVPLNRTIAKQCGTELSESTIANNSISDIKSNKTSPAYGILSDNLSELQELVIESNIITTINGNGAALSQTMDNATFSVATLLCENGTDTSDAVTLIPSVVPYEPTSGIYLLESDCAIVFGNTINYICAPDNQARGISLTKSNDVGIIENSVSKVKGPGIFIGGAPLPVGSESSPLLDLISASVRNIIHTNKTFDNTGKGIELGVSNWSNFYEIVELLGSEIIETNTVIGNHNQVAPEILRVICNTNGTVTIEARLIDPNHPNADFTIQFFTNSTNNIPHGETPISNFDGSEFIITTVPYGTNGLGVAQKTFTFIPLAQIKKGDNITAHVTLLSNGSEDLGDTSEFGVEVTTTAGYSSLNRPKPSSFCFNKILSRP